MLIQVNGKDHEVEQGTTLSTLLQDLGFALDGTAVAVNDEIVPKSTFDQYILNDHMKVDIFSLVAGG